MTDPGLLDALARFLGELPPAIPDTGLAFRVRIAAWLAAGLAREERLGPTHQHARAHRLAALLDLEVPGTPLAPFIEAAERHLSRLLRTDALDATALAAARAHVLADLGETLEVVQPTFDRRLDIEGRRRTNP